LLNKLVIQSGWYYFYPNIDMDTNKSVVASSEHPVFYVF
jgi:hypothetical protein